MDAEEIFRSVAQQVFAGAEEVETPDGRVPVRRTPSKRLRRVEFFVEGNKVVGIEQNPQTASQWAKLAREGHQVMQFREGESGRYIAVVVDDKVTIYGRSARRTPETAR
ncbi:MAG: hypothetical protein LAP13_10200 [Acidobacteriia bacterium]|nr:hypothetical protein [Terriglobia bacterium]